MPQPIPYLAFNGNCREAMEFYERLLGGEITIMMSGADSPMAAQIPPESAHRILHARLQFKDGGRLFAGDAPEHFPYGGQKGVTISLTYDTTAEGERVFNGLADGGTVTMPWGPTFWAKMFGMVTDRFGTSWMVNGEELPV